MKSINECSTDTLALVTLLQTVTTGETISYDQLTQEIGRDVTTVARHILQSARHIAQREYGLVFDTVATVGMKRLNSPEVIATGVSYMGRIRRTGRRWMGRLTSIRDFDDLTNDQKIQHNTQLAQAGVIVHISKESSAKKLQSKIDASGPLPIGKTLEAFKC